MFNADIEALVLSGELFNPQHRSSSPTRSDHASDHSGDEEEEDKGWHDEYLSQATEPHNNSFVTPTTAPPPEQQYESIGMGPGRTGVKGVIRDKAEAVELEKARNKRDMEELRQKMERGNLGGKTFLEEEREKAARGDEKVDPLVKREREDVFGRPRAGKFGFLREVGRHNFLRSVEGEERGTWVVVHLFDASLERCFKVDDVLTNLAGRFGDVKFVHCRASVVGFATKKKEGKTAFSRAQRRRIEEDDDPYKDEDQDDEQDEANDEDSVDLDMLPTMLVYRDGQLVFNWVRVDWEATAGIEELLKQHRIIPQKDTGGLEFTVDEDEDGDLLWDSD